MTEIRDVREIEDLPAIISKPEVDQRPTITSNDGWGIWSNLQENQDNVFSHMRVEGPRRHIWSSHNISDKHTRLKFEDLFVYGNVSWDGPLWGSRCYNVSAFVCKDSTFQNIGNFKGTFQFEGHAIYHNQLGEFVVKDTMFKNCLGQAIQLVWRKTETLLEEDPSGTITLDTVGMKDCAMNADRGSYPLSVFDTGHDVRLRRLNIWTTKKTPKWFNHRTGEHQRSRGGVFCAGANKADFIGSRINVLLMDPDRPAVKLERFTNVDWSFGVLRNIGENERRLQIAINDCEHGKITNLDGDFEIRRDGEVVAVNEDYEW